jgi:hypothetical protein
MIWESDRAQLARELADQHDELLRAAWRLEQSARMVPAVDEAEWQGPMRERYDQVLAGLRSVLTAASSELRRARAETGAALHTLNP